MKLSEDHACENFGASLTSINTDPSGFSGSNDFIVIPPDNKSSDTSWLKKRARNICSKKTLHKRIPILQWLPQYNKTNAVGDLIAGITMGLTVTPQAFAYSGIVGVKPEYGLYGSFLGCFIYIVFGSCKDASIGPTATLALLTNEALKGRGLEHVVLLCFLTGIVQLLMGFFRLGFLVDFISGPVSSGFTSAAALITITSLMNDMLGMNSSETNFIRTWKHIFSNYHTINVWDAGLGFICLGVLLSMRIITKLKIGSQNKQTSLSKIIKTSLWLLSISVSSILVVVTSYIAYIFDENGEPPFEITGHIPAGLPTVQLPPFSVNSTNQTETFIDMIEHLDTDILVVPLIGILEDIAVCKAFANGKAVDATQEFLALGLSNVANSFVQSFPITGALARSAVNHASGVKTTMGNLYTGILVIVSLLFFTPYFYYIPKATLAAIVIGATIFMVEVRVIKPMWRAKKTDLIPGIITFICCLVFPLHYGIVIGMVVDVLFILYHAARPKISLEEVTSSEGVKYLLLTPDRCLIFPSVHYVKNLVNKYSLQQKMPVVINCSYIYGADYTAATVVKTLIQDFMDRKQPLFFYNLKASVSSLFDALSHASFFTYYDREKFDEMLEKWRMETQELSV